VLIMLATGSQVSHDPVYPVAKVQAGLAHQPGVWVGRTVRVRGIAGVCLASDHPQSCSHGPMYLMDAIRSDAVLPLVQGRQDAVPAFLRRLPLVGTVVPAPEVLQWYTIATYHVHLQIEQLCPSTCYTAVLLDTAP
jgi:hypothetical protein